MSEFVKRHILETAVLFKFKELQEYFAKTGEKVYLVINEDDETYTLETAHPEYSSRKDHRKNMFAYYVKDLELENDIMGYIEEQNLADSFANSNIIFRYGMCCFALDRPISFEQFLVAIKRHKNGEYNPLFNEERYKAELNKKPSILTEYLEADEKKLCLMW